MDNQGNPHIPKLFVCGSPKSGTTWVQLMLNAHPGIACGGEGHLTDWLIAPFRKMIEEYNRELLWNSNFVYGDKSAAPGITNGDFKKVARLIIDTQFSKTAALKPEAKWVGDKTPNYVYALGLLAEIYPDAKFVFVTRDPRDAAISMLRQTRRLEREKGVSLYEKDETVISNFLSKWREVVGLYRSFHRLQPNAIHLTQYETMLKDPNASLVDLLRFLFVSDDQSLIDHCVSATAFEKLSGGRETGQVDDNAFFRFGRSGAWGEAEEDRFGSLLTEETLEEMALLGYRPK